MLMGCCVCCVCCAALCCCASPLPGAPQRVPPWRSVGRVGQHDALVKAATGGFVQHQVAAVGARGALDDGQPQASAARAAACRLAARKGLAQLFALGRGNARHRAHPQRHLLQRGRRRHCLPLRLAVEEPFR